MIDATIEDKITPVHSLAGTTLKSGWNVKEKVTQLTGSTGSHFSICYIVEKDGAIGFMKALNLLKFLQADSNDLTTAFAGMLNSFNFEKELLTRCTDAGLSKISRLHDSGVENVAGYIIPNVPYLIFEKADGDVRRQLNFAQNIDSVWKLRSLHDIAVGLKQLHGIEISHQDVKPSNVFVYDQDISKLGDLGRSLCQDISGPHSKLMFSGDHRYMPPEIMFKYFLPEWKARSYAIDCYLLGSMIVFYFTGTSMTALFLEHLSRGIEWNSYIGRFQEALQYLILAFDESLEDITTELKSNPVGKEIVDMIRQLCYPDPNMRGHKKNIEQRGSNYSLERIVTILDVLTTKAEYLLKRN